MIQLPIPCNATEEIILFDVLNLSLPDKGFCAGENMLETRCKRAAEMLAISQRCVQRKIAQICPLNRLIL